MRHFILFFILVVCTMSVVSASDGYNVNSDFVLSTYEEKAGGKNPVEKKPIEEVIKEGYLYDEFLLNMNSNFFLASMNKGDSSFITDYFHAGVDISVIPRVKTVSLGFKAAAFFINDGTFVEEPELNIINYYFAPMVSIMYPVMPMYLYLYLDASVGGGIWQDTNSSSFELMRQLFWGATAEIGAYIVIPYNVAYPVIIRVGGSSAWQNNRLLLGFNIGFSFKMSNL